MPIEHISDTARWVAVYRAMETERPDALFHDPFARRLAGDRGTAIVEGMRRGRSTAWAMIVRTAVFDEMILDLVTRERVGLVVNLAAGLDARPWRLPFPPALRWVDVDLPGILDYKLDALRDARPTCHYEAVRADLTDDAARSALFARLGDRATPTLAVAEGLLIYLSGAQVGALARALSAELGARWWLVDLASPDLLRLMNRYWGRDVQQAASPFQFGPAEGTAFFRAFGWREARYRSMIEEAHRLRREMRLMWFWRLLSRLSSARRRERARRMSGFVLLERDTPATGRAPTPALSGI